jgi:hypothetical protein
MGCDRESTLGHVRKLESISVQERLEQYPLSRFTLGDLRFLNKMRECHGISLGELEKLRGLERKAIRDGQDLVTILKL